LPSTDPNGPGTDNWEVEESLDVEWAHAIAPGAQIILVEADSQSLSDLMASVATAAGQPRVSVVSMSWDSPEGQAVFASDEATYDSVFNVPGVTVRRQHGRLRSGGSRVSAFSTNVVPSAARASLSRGQFLQQRDPDGLSVRFRGAFIGLPAGYSACTSPSRRISMASSPRAIEPRPMSSLVADPDTGAWIADTYNLDPGDPFEIVGGTSLSAPAWAGLLTLANQGRVGRGRVDLEQRPPPDRYGSKPSTCCRQSDYNAIASGTNGYSAGAGYNLVTGPGLPWPICWCPT